MLDASIHLMLNQNITNTEKVHMSAAELSNKSDVEQPLPHRKDWNMNIKY